MREAGDEPRRFSRAAAVAWAGLTAAVLARTYLTVVAALGLLATVPLAFGLSAVVVTGNSMRPSVNAGDVVLTSGLAASAPLPMGRVVVFDAPQGSAATGRVLHRIVATNKDGSLVTAGDANTQYDSAPLEARDIDGVAVVLARWIGLPLYWMTTQQYGLLLLFITLTGLSLAVELREFLGQRGLRLRGPPLAVALLVVGTLVAVVGTASQQDASANFTSRAQSAGNTWRYPAPNAPVRLAFSATPSVSPGGTAFSVQPRVALLDADGAPTPVARKVTLTVTGGAGVLTCDQNPVETTNGTAAFAGCSVDRTGTYTLMATVTGLESVSSASFTIVTGGPARLAFGASPGTTSVGTAFASQPVVRILDAGGNQTASSSPVSLTLDEADGATLACAENPKAAVAGVATFAGCSVNGAGTYTLTARAGNLAQATTSAFVVTGRATTTALGNLSPASGTTGTTFSARATVTGNAGVGTPAGTLVFRLYTSSTCSNTASYTTPAQTLVGGAATGTLRPSAGIYYWRATYTPSDSDNLGSTSSCSAAITVTAALGTYSATGTAVTVTSTGSNVAVPYPAGTSAGDLALLVVVNNSAQGSTVSASGWSAIANPASTSIQLQAWWHTVGSETSTSIARLPATSSGATAWVIIYKNMPNPTLAGVSSGAPGTPSLTLAPSTLTTTAANATVISLTATNASRNLSLSTTRNFTRRAALSATGGTGRALGAADRFLSTAGTLAPPTWSAGAFSNWAYITVAFTP